MLPKKSELPKIWRGCSPLAPSPPPPPFPAPTPMWSIDELVRRDGAIKQKGKLPEKDFAKNELQTPQRALMTILVSLLHYNTVKKKIEFD